MRRLKAPGGKLRSLAYSPDGSKLAAAGDAGVTKVWDAATGRELATLRDPDAATVTPAMYKRVRELAFSHDGKLLATGTLRVRVWDVGTATEVPFPDEAGESCPPMAFAPDDASLILMQGSGAYGRPHRFESTVLAWSRATGRIERPYLEAREGSNALAVSASADLLALSCWQQLQCYVSLWGLTDNRERGKIDLPRLPQDHLWSSVQELAFSPDGRALAVAQGSYVLVFELPGKRLRGKIEGHAQQVTSVAFAPHGRHLATASLDGTVRLWDAESLGERAAYDWKLGKMRGVRFHPDGMTAAAVGEKAEVAIWDVEGG